MVFAITYEVWEAIVILVDFLFSYDRIALGARSQKVADRIVVKKVKRRICRRVPYYRHREGISNGNLVQPQRFPGV